MSKGIKNEVERSRLELGAGGFILAAGGSGRSKKI